MMWRRLLLVNFVLVSALVAGVVRVRQSWKEFETSHRVEAVKPEPEPSKTIPAATVLSAAAEDWTDISVKDPFSFDRNDISIVALKPGAPTQPKPVLFGTMSLGSERIAMLAPGQSGTRASRPVKVGETLDSWQVVEIQDRSVIVAAANGARETIIINDPSALVPRASERTGPAGVVAAPVNVIGAAPATAAPATAGTPTAPPAAQQQPAAQAPSDILQTPFGPVKRTSP